MTLVTAHLLSGVFFFFFFVRGLYGHGSQASGEIRVGGWSRAIDYDSCRDGYVMSVLGVRSRFCGRVSARPWDLGGPPIPSDAYASGS